MKIQAYYQNWQIFWGGNVTPKIGPLTPNTWTSIAPGLDRISYGFAIFGEEAYCNDPPTCSQEGYKVLDPQTWAANEMYPGDVFPWMKGTTDDDTDFPLTKSIISKLKPSSDGTKHSKGDKS